MSVEWERGLFYIANGGERDLIGGWLRGPFAIHVRAVGIEVSLQAGLSPDTVVYVLDHARTGTALAVCLSLDDIMLVAQIIEPCIANWEVIDRAWARSTNGYAAWEKISAAIGAAGFGAVGASRILVRGNSPPPTTFPKRDS